MGVHCAVLLVAGGLSPFAIVSGTSFCGAGNEPVMILRGLGVKGRSAGRQGAHVGLRLRTLISGYEMDINGHER